MMKEEKSRSMMERAGEAKPADVPAAAPAAAQPPPLERAGEPRSQPAGDSGVVTGWQALRHTPAGVPVVEFRLSTSRSAPRPAPGAR